MNQILRTILIVDDSPEDIETYRRYLRNQQYYSYTILEASRGDEGLELWQQYQPDVVLLDFQLPDMNGLQFLAKLQSPNQQLWLPVIFVTGQGSESIAVEAIKGVVTGLSGQKPNYQRKVTYSGECGN